MMTAIERDAYFSRKKEEVLKRLLGAEMRYPIVEEVTTRLVSPIGKKWFNEPRVHNDPRCITFSKSLREFNEQNRINHGRYVKVDNTPLEAEVAAPIK